jgi:hypothetical protein
MDEEVPYDSEFTQMVTFTYLTECSGVSCLVNEIVRPGAQTLALGVGLVFVLIFAVYRRGKSAGLVNEVNQNFSESDDELPVVEEKLIPVPIVEEEDEIELLDELEEI